MKHYFHFYIFIPLFLWTPQSKAQDYAYKKAELYLLKSDYTATNDQSEAKYILQLEKNNDTTFICRYYTVVGPMVRQESYLDSNLTIPNGEFAWYDVNGIIDSSAKVSRGKKIYFASYNDSLKTMISVRFRNDSIYEKRDRRQNLYTDSSGNTSDLAKKEKAEHEKSVADSAAAKAVPAKFGKKGSIREWQNYVNKHISVPDRFTNTMKVGSYTVIMSFLINKKGEVTELLFMRSCELSADLQFLEVFKNSPLWQPATMYGQPAIYRQRQSATFSVEY